MSHWKIIEGNELEWYFLTATIVHWLKVFKTPEEYELLLSSLRFCQAKKELRIAGFVIMPNHFHMIASGSRNHSLSDSLRDLKQFAAKKIVRKLEQEGMTRQLSVFRKAASEDRKGNRHKVWMEGNHPILLDDEDMFLQKLEYIHQNPVAKGLAENPEDWAYSSARNYLLEDHSLLHVECL